MRSPPDVADRGAPARPCHPYVPVRQWMLSLPIPLRLSLAAEPELVTLMLQVVHHVITRFLLDQAELKAEQADSGSVTLIQRFASRVPHRPFQ